MGNNQKPPIDWTQVRALYVAGVRPPSLARLFPVSKQGIMKRARKEGWIRATDRRDAEAWIEVAQETRIAHARTSGSALGKRSPGTIGAILSNLAEGVPESIAALAAGISRETMRRWKDLDPEFALACQHAKATALADRVRRLTDAGKRGDWKADAYMLERAEDTRDEFGPSALRDRSISVIINVERGPGVNPEEPPVIDVVSAEVPDEAA